MKAGGPRIFVVAWGLFGGLACADDPRRPPIVWEGEHLRFGTDEALTRVCGGTLAHADNVAAYLGTILGHPDAIVDYYWVPDLEGTPCATGAYGCADGSAAFGKAPFLQHELVHAVGGPFHSPNQAIEEGVAEAFGDDYPADAPSGDIASLLSTHGSGHKIAYSEYPLAGHFASFLRVEGGDDALADAWRTLREGADWSRTRAVLEDVYGRPVEDTIADYEASYPLCDRTYFRDNGFECAQDAVRLPTQGEDPNEVVVELDLSCDAPDVLGPRLGERWKTMTVDLVVDTYYQMGIEKIGGAQPGAVWIRECGQSCFELDGSQSFIVGDFTADVHAAPSNPDDLYGDPGCIHAGRYTIGVAIADDDAGEVIVHLRAVGIC